MKLWWQGSLSAPRMERVSEYNRPGGVRVATAGNGAHKKERLTFSWEWDQPACSPLWKCTQPCAVMDTNCSLLKCRFATLCFFQDNADDAHIFHFAHFLIIRLYITFFSILLRIPGWSAWFPTRGISELQLYKNLPCTAPAFDLWVHSWKLRTDLWRKQ